jgi:hypothetical protein
MGDLLPEDGLKGEGRNAGCDAALSLFYLTVLFYQIDHNSSAIYLRLYLACFVADRLLRGVDMGWGACLAWGDPLG